MLRVKIITEVVSMLSYTYISVFCPHCGFERECCSKPGESLGKNVGDYCHSCNQLLPTLDYLVPEEFHCDTAYMRVIAHRGIIT